VESRINWGGIKKGVEDGGSVQRFVLSSPSRAPSESNIESRGRHSHIDFPSRPPRRLRRLSPRPCAVDRQPLPGQRSMLSRSPMSAPRLSPAARIIRSSPEKAFTRRPPAAFATAARLLGGGCEGEIRPIRRVSRAAGHLGFPHHIPAGDGLDQPKGPLRSVLR